MLARLRHDALIERHDQQDCVDRADAGEHVADEVLMPRDIDDPDVRTVGKSQPREPEVDRHPALALLGQAVGIDARQRGDEGGFSVVDMAGSRDDAGRLFGHDARAYRRTAMHSISTFAPRGSAPTGTVERAGLIEAKRSP